MSCSSIFIEMLSVDFTVAMVVIHRYAQVVSTDDFQAD